MWEMCAELLVWFVSLAAMRDAGSLKAMDSKLFKTLKVIKEIIWKKSSRHNSQIYYSHFGSIETDQTCGEIISDCVWKVKGTQMAEVCVLCRKSLWRLRFRNEIGKELIQILSKMDRQKGRRNLRRWGKPKEIKVRIGLGGTIM